MALYRHRTTSCIVALLVCLIGLCHAIYTPYAKGVRLEDVQAITLHRGDKTTSRRSRAVPQLSCVGGPCEFEPDTVQCVNVGSDGMDVQWRCEADLPRDIKFARTQVTCEGYDYPDDERVLEGSCGLEYSLKRVGGGGSWFSNSRATHSGDYYSTGDKRTSEPPRTSWHAGQWILLVLVMYIGYHLGRAYRQGTHRQQPPHPRRPGGDDDDDDDVRPSAPPSPSSGFFSRGASQQTYGGNRKAGTSATGSGSAWNGWTGAAAGYGLGYLMRNRGAGRQPASPSGNSWFSRGTDTTSQRNRRASTSRSKDQPVSAESEKATGYASTSRR